MSDIIINGITYPSSRRVAFPGSDGKEVIFDLPEEAEAVLNGTSTRPPQTRAVYNAVEDLRQRQTSPYNFKGVKATKSDLPSSGNTVNDTWYVTADKCRYTWTGSAWEQSSLDEGDYEDELGALTLGALQYQGTLAAGTDPGGLTAPGWWAVTAAVMEELAGISSPGIFLNFSTPVGTVQTQQIVTTGGDVLVRLRSGAFSPLNNATAIARRAALVRDSVTPDTVTEIGYYISPPTVTEDFTGIREYALFIHSQTAAGADFVQVFVTAGGRILTRRRGTDEAFTEAYREAVGLMVSSSSTAKTNASDCAGGLIHCFIPAGGGRHLRVSFVHGHWDTWQPGESTAYKSSDHYRLDSGVLGRLQAGAWDPEEMLVVSGAWDGAVYTGYDAGTLAPSGTAFGTFHGWETFTRCIIKVDGATLADLAPGDTLPDLDPAGCRCVEIFYWANLYLPGTSTLAAAIFKRYTITDEGVHAETRYQWAAAGSRAMYNAMGCFSRALTDHAVCDYDHTLYDISDGAETPITTSANNRQGVSWCAEMGTETDALCEIRIEPPAGMYIQNNLSANYNKVYFNRAGQVAAGDVWTAKVDYCFGGRKR